MFLANLAKLHVCFIELDFVDGRADDVKSDRDGYFDNEQAEWTQPEEDGAVSNQRIIFGMKSTFTAK